MQRTHSEYILNLYHEIVLKLYKLQIQMHSKKLLHKDILAIPFYQYTLSDRGALEVSPQRLSRRTLHIHTPCPLRLQA